MLQEARRERHFYATSTPSVMPQPPAHNRARVRFDGTDRTPTPDGHQTIAVRLTWDGRTHEAESTGVQTREGGVRASALATLDATRSVLHGRGPSFELIGVKALRAFDAFVVIVSVDIREKDVRRRVIGARTCETDDLADAAATATLDAINRLLEKYL
jgi:hypothetical protein